MIFLHPEFIYYMLPVLIVLFVLLIMQKEVLEQHFSDDVMSRLRVNANSLTLKARNALFFLAGVLIILALAQPVLEGGKVKVKSTSADILIALDISDSMLAQDVYPNRLESAKKKALELIDRATKDRVGVIAFAKNSYLVSPISFDSKTVSFLLSKLDTSSITQKGTSFLTMLETVAKTNTNTDKKYLLVLSDGGDETDFSAEIAFAKEKGITVFILGMGTEAGAPIKKRDGSFIKHNDKIIISALNESISEFAIKTGGVYIQNTTSLKDIEAMLSEIIKNSEHKELKSQEIQRYVPLFYYPIILAMLLLLVAFSSIGKRVKHKMPASAFILFALIFSTSPSVAGMFDFLKLEDAKRLDNAQELYDAKDYNSSAQIYEKYAQKNNNGEAYYNAGNAYYKGKQYLKALSAYSFARIENKDLEASRLANMGNALVQLGTINSLERAVKHYEASLKIREDKLIRETLEAVKKILEENKDKSKEEEKPDKDKEAKEQKTDEKGDDADEANDTNNKNKNKDPKNNDSSKSNKSAEEQNPDNKKESDDGKPSDDEKDGDEDPSESNDAGDAKEQTKELKDKSKKEVEKKNSGAESGTELQEMSDSEEAKWLKKLNSKQNTYLYRLNEQEDKKKDKNEKPW